MQKLHIVLFSALFLTVAASASFEYVTKSTGIELAYASEGGGGSSGGGGSTGGTTGGGGGSGGGGSHRGSNTNVVYVIINYMIKLHDITPRSKNSVGTTFAKNEAEFLCKMDVALNKFQASSRSFAYTYMAEKLGYTETMIRMFLANPKNCVLAS